MLPCKNFLRLYSLRFALCLLLSAAAQGQFAPSPRRITAAVNETERVMLKGNVHPLAQAQFDRGPVPGSLPMERMLLLLKGSPEQDAALEKLIRDQQDPASPQYHRWLTPEEFGERFGPSQQDIEAIQTWLRGHGFVVSEASDGRRVLEFSGTAAQVQQAFHTGIRNYMVDGKGHYANADDPQIPSALAPVVHGIVSLHDFRKRPLHRLLTPMITGSDGRHALGAHDFATIYNVLPLWNAGKDGTGQKIAIISRSNINTENVTDFRSSFGLAGNPPQIILNGTDPGIVNEDSSEATLDVEWSGAVAKGATIALVVSKDTSSADGIDLSALYAVDHNVAPIISVSYGGCENSAQGYQFYQYLWQQAAAQGISVFVATGDNGSAGCDEASRDTATGGFGVNLLAATSHNVAVGGTQLDEGTQTSLYWSTTNGANHLSALRYIPEVVWNESGAVSDGSGLWAGSGGVSIMAATPEWQKGTGVPQVDPGTTDQHHRYLPDVSLSAARHDGYLACIQRECNGSAFSLVSGTSASTPAFAGIMAIINQHTGTIQGNPNYRLYALSQIPGVYHDVTSGDNAVPCSGGSPNCSSTVSGQNGKLNGYAATPGFDLATGWGSVDAYALATNWNNTSFAPTKVTATLSPTTLQHGTPLNYSVTVAPVSGSGVPTGSLAFYVVGDGKTTSFGTAKLVDGAASGSERMAIPGGASQYYVRYSGDAAYASSTSDGIDLTVSPEPSSINLDVHGIATLQLGQTFRCDVAVSGQSGAGWPSGAVEIREDGVAIAQGTLDPLGQATVSVTVKTAGAHRYTATYLGDKSFELSTSPEIAITVNKAQVYGFLSSSPLVNPSRPLLKGTSIRVAYQFVSNAGGVKPTGLVQFYDGSTPLGSPVSLEEGTLIASILVSDLAVGNHSISAMYPGDLNFSPYTTTAINFDVTSQATITAKLWGPDSQTTPGMRLSLQGELLTNAAGPALKGTVTLFDGNTPVASQPISGSQVYWFNLNDTANPLTTGTHTYTFKYSGDGTWPAATSSPLALAVIAPEFKLTAESTTFTVTKGGQADVRIQITSLNGLDTAVTFSCSGLPAQSGCGVGSTRTYGGTAWFYVSIWTTAPHTVSGLQSSPRSPWWQVGGLAFGCVVMLGIPRRRRKVGILMGLLLAGIMSVSLSCGGGGAAPAQNTNPTPRIDPGTPSGTYAITVTGTSGAGASAVSRKIDVTLTVL